MKKLMICAALAGALLFAPRAAFADPTQEFNDAMKQMQEGIPVLMKTLQVLQREGPALLDIMQRANAAAEKNGGPMVTAKPGEMPTADEMAQKIRGLQSMAEVMKQAMPILTRMQRDLDPAKLHPDYKPRKNPVTTPPQNWNKDTQGVPGSADPNLQY